MDNVNKQKIKDFLDNTALFYSLVKNKDENQQSLESIIELLKIQHSMNKHALMSLGVSFDDTNKIREMNQRIRQLESELAQNGDVNFKKANQFIYFEQTKLQDYLDEKGISCSVEFIMTSNLKVSIHIYDRDVNYKPFYAENDDEAAQLIEKNSKKNEAFKNNFDLLIVNNQNDEPINYYLLFSNKNIEKLEIIFNDYFNSRISQIEYEVKIKNDGITIHDYNFFLTNLDSAQLFSQAITKD